MNSEVENSIAMWLMSLPAFKGVRIHAGQTDEEIPGDESCLFVVCDSADSPAPSLMVAGIKLAISTPVIMPGMLSAHQKLVSILRSSLANTNDAAAFFPPTLTLCGYAISGKSEQRDATHWISEVSLTAGLVDLLA